MSRVISFENVSFSYGRNKVLEDIDLFVEKGDFTAIVGPNGGGKTTILKLILGLLSPQKGELKVFGQSPCKSRIRTGYVPQFSVHDRSFPIDVENVVMQGLIGNTSFGPFYSKNVKKKVADIIEKLGLTQRMKDRFGDLSGGLKQRTLIARAVVSQPELLLLDEPVSSVDSSVEKDVFEMLNLLNKKMTIVLVSHDIGFVSKYVNKIACVNKTLVIHDAGEITSGIIEDAYRGKQVAVNHSCGI